MRYIYTQNISLATKMTTVLLEKEFEEHVNGRRSSIVDIISNYLGEVPAILSYGARHIARTLDAQAQLQPDRIITKPALRVKEVFTVMASVFGSILVTNLRAQCRDPDHWEDPDTFKPSRFEPVDTNKSKYVLHTYPFVPFSAGERKCPGFMTTRALFFGFLFALRGNLRNEGKYEIVQDPTRPAFDIPKDTTLVRVSRIHRAALIKSK